MGHLVQKRQGFRSTKPKIPATSSTVPKLSQVRSNELQLQVTPVSKLYTDDTGCLPVHVRSGNQCIMIAYHCDTNLILTEPFASRKDAHRLMAYYKIMQRLSENKLIVDLQILYNEASAEYNRAIKTKWNANDQLVPPNTHRSNADERAIRTFGHTFSPSSPVSLHISQ